MGATIKVPERDSSAAEAKRPRLRHVYLPYSENFTLDGIYPPTGARALCGHVKPAGPDRDYDRGSPDDCAVCLSLWDGMR